MDRIDNSRGYEPGNVRWATRSEQMRNTRQSVWLEFRGEKKTLPEWAEWAGLPRECLRQRLASGWSVEQALTQPYQGRRSTADVEREVSAQVEEVRRRVG